MHTKRTNRTDRTYRRIVRLSKWLAAEHNPRIREQIEQQITALESKLI